MCKMAWQVLDNIMEEGKAAKIQRFARCQIERSKAAQLYEGKATKAMRMKNEDGELPALIT
jgi:hypothetical protein